MNTNLWLNHTRAGPNKHEKVQMITSFTDLLKILNMAETASGSNVQSKQSTCYRNLT